MILSISLGRAGWRVHRSHRISGFGEPVAIAVGEQPPLFSQAGDSRPGCRAGLETTGYEVAFEWRPIGRMLALLQQDSLDVYVTLQYPRQHNPHVDFLEARGVFFYKKARFPNLKAERLADLAAIAWPPW
jgi:hypothetical protein